MGLTLLTGGCNCIVLHPVCRRTNLFSVNLNWWHPTGWCIWKEKLKKHKGRASWTGERLQEVQLMEQTELNSQKFFQVRGGLIIHIIRGRSILLQHQELLILFPVHNVVLVICFCCLGAWKHFCCLVLNENWYRLLIHTCCSNTAVIFGWWKMCCRLAVPSIAFVVALSSLENYYCTVKKGQTILRCFV
jgi:hypothetical protein